MDKSTLKGYLYAIASAVIYGCMPLMAKHIYADGVNPLTLVFLRNFFSLIPLGLLTLRERGSLKLSLKLLPEISLLSVLGCCVTPILLFSSYQYIASGTATVFHFVYPAVVVAAEILILRAKAKLGNILGVALCIVGISLFYTPGQPLDLTGSALALLSGITFAAYVLLLAHFKRSGVSGFLLCFYVTAVSSVASLLVCLVSGNLALPASLGGWGLCVLFSLLVTTGAVALFQRSAFLIGSERTSILSTLEPITGVIIGVVAFGEPMGWRTILGSVLVVAASLTIALLDLRKNK